MADNELSYTKGYSIGVGGVVSFHKKVLLVQRTAGEDIGEWVIPGGFVERKETLDDAVTREIYEETGVKAKVDGLIGVRNRLYQNENSVYLVFLLTAVDEGITIQKSEVDKAKFFSVEEVRNLDNLQALSKNFLLKFFNGEFKVLAATKPDDFPEDKYLILD